MKRRLMFSVGILLAIALAVTGAVYAGNRTDEMPEAPEVTGAGQMDDAQMDAVIEPALVPGPDDDVLVKDTTPPPTMEEKLAYFKEGRFDGTGVMGRGGSPDTEMWRLIDDRRQSAEEVLWYGEQGVNFSEQDLQRARDLIALCEEIKKMYAGGAEIDDVLMYYLVQIDEINKINGLE